MTHTISTTQVDEIRDLVAQYFEIDNDFLEKGRRMPENIATHCLAYILVNDFGFSHTTAGVLLKRSRSSISYIVVSANDIDYRDPFWQCILDVRDSIQSKKWK